MKVIAMACHNQSHDQDFPEAAWVVVCGAGGTAEEVGSV
jgi:hypothetical protein